LNLPEFARPGSASRRAWSQWWPLAFGVGLLLLPSWLRYATGIWQEDEYSHEPIVLAMALYLFWRQRDALLQAALAPLGSLRLGASLLILGAFVYVPGVWIQSGFLESSSEVLLIGGSLALMGGWPLLRLLVLPLLLLVLAAPLPGNVIAAATGTLKEWVSASAEFILYHAGYPIGRSGVTLTIGVYRLLVADACSGMNSLFSLSAVGIFYLYLVPRAHRWQTAMLAGAILPIAIVANIFRVIILILITYHLGDAAGQGFLHEFAGMLMFMIAVGALVSLEGMLRMVSKHTASPTTPEDSHA